MRDARDALDRVRETGDTEAFEDAIALAADRLSAEIVRTALQSLDMNKASIVDNGKRYAREGVSRKRVMTSFGAVEYERSQYRRRGCRTLFPADRRAGLIESFWTPRAARIALHKVSSLPPRACVADFRQRGGMCPSVSSLIRLYEAAGRHWEEIADDALARIRAAEAIPDEASCVTVQIDGVMVPVGQDKRKTDERLGGIEWREAACATISLGDASGNLLRTIRHGRMPERNKLRLKQLVVDEVASLRQRRPDLTLVTVANGAQDNWRFLETAFPQATPVLDFYHCAEHLKSALDMAYGEGHRRAHRRWQALRETLLAETDGVDKVIASLDYLRRAYAPSVAGTLRYFRNNRHRMRYADYRARNLMIGSGLVEATNKVLITSRMKGSGMIWGHSGGQAILTLRSLELSGRFDRAWKILSNHWKKTNLSESKAI